MFYNNSEENSFVKNGELVIIPTVLSDEKFIKEGSLTLKRYSIDVFLKLSNYCI